MGTDDIFHKRKEKKAKKREEKDRGTSRESFLIVCEGERTEPLYFKSFPLSSVSVKVEGVGANTLRLVKRAIELYKVAKAEGEIYDQVWVVMDRDDFPAHNFNNALDLADKHDIQVAYSNQAFEIWYLLHFHYFHTGMSRDQYKEKLTSLLGFPYKKNDPNMYKVLKEKQPQAITHAKNLLNSHTPHNPEQDNPCTTVHLLVQKLHKYIK